MRLAPAACHADEGLPAGLQFLGRPLEDGRVLALAYAFEQVTQHRRPPLLFPECRGPLGDAAPAGRPPGTAG